MIEKKRFDEMLHLVKVEGQAGKPMPNFGYLRDATREQIRELNEAYNDARNAHASRRG